MLLLHLPRVPPPYTITSEISFPTYEFWRGHKYSVYCSMLERVKEAYFFPRLLIIKPKVKTSKYISHCFKTALYLVCMLSRFSRVQLFATPWIAACQAPLSMGFFRQEHWSGLPCPPPGDLPNCYICYICYISCLDGRFFSPSATWEDQAWLVRE